MDTLKKYHSNNISYLMLSHIYSYPLLYTVVASHKNSYFFTFKFNLNKIMDLSNKILVDNAC